MQDIQKRGAARKIAKAAGKLVPKHDHSRENERSLTGLLGAVLSKQMKAELAKQKAAKARKEAEKAANPGLLKRTFSKKDVKLSDDQPAASTVTADAPAPKLASRPSMKDVFSMGTPPPK